MQSQADSLRAKLPEPQFRRELIFWKIFEIVDRELSPNTLVARRPPEDHREIHPE